MPSDPTTISDPAPGEGTGRRAGLSRDEVVDTALDLVETGGAEALTMRKLAAELGVTTTTIYWHVGGRDELITAVIERLSQRQAAAPLDGDTPRERVMSATRNVWNSALEHPEVTSLAYQSGAMSVLEMHLEIALARELEAAGLRGEPARDALRGILLSVGGFLVLALRDDEAIPHDRRGHVLWSQVDADLDPATIAALSTPVDLPALFESTIRAVVDSFLPTTETTHPPEQQEHP